MFLKNAQKLIGALVLSLLVVVLMLFDKVTAEAGMPFLTAVGGYILGNGIGAVQNKTIEPIISSKQDSHA